MGPCHSFSGKFSKKKNAPCPDVIEKLTTGEIFAQTSENSYKKEWKYSMPTFMSFGDNPMFLQELYEVTLNFDKDDTFSIKKTSKFGLKLCKCTQDECFNFLIIELSGKYEVINSESNKDTLKLNCTIRTYDYYHMHGTKKEEEIQKAEMQKKVFLLDITKEGNFQGHEGYLFRMKQK